MASSKNRVASKDHSRTNSSFFKTIQHAESQRDLESTQNLRNKRHSFTPKREAPQTVAGSYTERACDRKSTAKPAIADKLSLEIVNVHNVKAVPVA